MGPWNIGSRTVVVGLLFIGVILVRRTLNNDQFGVYTILKTWWTYAWMVGGLGLNYVALRFFSELAKKGGYAGFKRLLSQCFIFQGISVAVLMVGFTYAGFCMDQSRNIGPGLMALTVAWAAMQMWKETLKQVFTGYYWIRFVAILSVGCVVVFPGVIYVFIVVLNMGAEGAILAEAGVYALMIVCHLGAYKLLVRQVKESEQGSEERRTYTISNNRIFKYAGAYVGNNIIGLMFGKHALVMIVFFLLGDAYTGHFGLAADIPEQGMMFMLLPVMSLIMAALTRAYATDESRMPSLIGSYYKMMMIVLMPMFVFSIVFMDKFMLLVFGSNAMGAADVSRYTFVLYLPILVATPMTAALNLREKAQQLVLIRLVTGLLFIAAIIATLFVWKYQANYARIGFINDSGVLSLMPKNPLYLIVYVALLKCLFLSPWIFWKARRILGSLYFPKAFFLRALGVSMTIFSLWPLRWLWDKAYGCEDYILLRPIWWLWDIITVVLDLMTFALRIIINLFLKLEIGQNIKLEISQATFGTLCVTIVFLIAYAVCYCIAARLFGLFRQEEVSYFRNSHIPGSMLLMRLFVARKYR